MARVEFAAAAENAVAAGRPAPTGDQVTAAATAIASRISSKQAAVPAPAAPAADPATLVAASAVAAAAASEVTPEARRVARRQRHLAEAAKMHEAAAERGLATAQYNLATCYMEGTGIEEDKAKAVQNYEKAAAQGHWMVSATGSNRVTTDLGSLACRCPRAPHPPCTRAQELPSKVPLCAGSHASPDWPRVACGTVLPTPNLLLAFADLGRLVGVSVDLCRPSMRSAAAT